jgi:hypothetical protein
MSELKSAYIVASGRDVVVAMEGTAGKVGGRWPHNEGHPPQVDPCPACEHRSRCQAEFGTIEGCDTAEGWARAQREYGRLMEPGQLVLIEG